VLANYGLEEKAAELLVDVIDLQPGHLEATALAAKVQGMIGRGREASALAATAAELADEEGRPEVWDDLAGFLVAEGYEVEDGRVVPPLEAVGGEEPAAAAADTAEQSPVPQSKADKRLDWLDEPAGRSRAEDAEELFDQEEDFFDLAGELEEELRREDMLDEEFEPQPAEQTLEEIVEGFRKGVAETLSAEDYDTHYNLGIAYREMGLVDEAIGEFQLAAKDARYLVDCCSLLGACFLEKGFPDLAVKWHQRGLKSPHITEKETLGLLYELGSLYATTGDTEAALETFTEIYGTNSNYRDVVARLAELSGSE
jgi:tetratricopeptide (TPR) repeat protein